MFGKESKGLPEELLQKHPDRCVRIPMRNGLRSLNLSNSVAVAAYEILRQDGFSTLQSEGEPTTFSWDDTGMHFRKYKEGSTTEYYIHKGDNYLNGSSSTNLKISSKNNLYIIP
jgi:tRNA C32,U32 (ribose-2'-O)-methylase TrmJ